MKYKSVMDILKEHESLKNGTTVVYYDNKAFSEVVRFIRYAYSDDETSNQYYDYAYDYRYWGDGVHASCFFSWCDCEGTIFYVGFDCYV